ncbi:MAG: hypothetical protein MJ185_02405 [Treponema sp.]|nr:hypothetical protein [Treponema sp.]
MKKVVLLCSLLLASLPVFAQDNNAKFKGWKKAKTQHFTFVYEDASKEAAEGFIKIADDAWNKVAKIYSIPKENITVYVTGRTNTVNAYTFSSPVEIMMFTNPCTLTDFPFRDNWQQLFFTHELIHAANFSFEDRLTWPEKVFGPYMTTANFASVNGWALEGLTTVLETELGNGGRGRSPYFELDYKSLTLDNGFLAYEDVGLEKEPPYGQSYVIGYLLMRTIADKYGIQALADIERNRKWGDSWESAVKLVTGETAQDLYRDVRIALAKKYNEERKIPEGIIISPRDLNTNYGKPAIVLDDGTLITLRSADGAENAVVRLDPAARSGRNYIEDTNPEKDLNTVFKETVLFTGPFMDSECITADENGNVFAVMGIVSADRGPGQQVKGNLYSWNKENGLKLLVKDTTLFQPSVSRDGKTLVAVEQNGMQLRLVKVDVETGARTVILEDKNISFMEPNVNADGTKVAFLAVDWSRARVGVMDLNESGSYEIVANDGETIYDPTYPIWNNDGLLTYTSNNRGRLETFEVTKGEDGKWISTPMLSDPIGVLWAYKNDKGIYYRSKSSSGMVIKMKPLSEWGKVADFEGPSPAGEKICFGNLTNDYPDFVPYTVLSEVEEPEKTEEELKEEKKAAIKKAVKKDQAETEEPVPVRGKTVKHRSEENKKAAEEATAVITEITDEKKYIPMIQPMFWFPILGYTVDLEGKERLGLGGIFLGMTPKLQLNIGELIGAGFYYPGINNFSSFLGGILPVRSNYVEFAVSRSVGAKDKNGQNLFYEKNKLMGGFVIPILNRSYVADSIYLGVENANALYFYRISETSSSITGDYSNYLNMASVLELDFAYQHKLPRSTHMTYSASVSTLGLYDCDMKNFQLGYKANGYAAYGLNGLDYKLAFKGAYMPVQSTSILSPVSMFYAGDDLDYSYPIRFIPSVEIASGIQGAGVKYYVETLMSGNESTFFWDQTVSRGVEASLGMAELSLKCGVSFLCDFKKNITIDDIYKDYKFYFDFSTIFD